MPMHARVDLHTAWTHGHILAHPLTNPQVRTFFGRVTRRLHTEQYLLRTKLQQTAWDILATATLSRILLASLVVDEMRPGAIPPEDPFWQATRGHRSFGPPQDARQHMYRLPKAWIEPEWGHVICEPATVVDLALEGSDWARRAPRVFFAGQPALTGYLSARRGLRRVQREHTVITLRHHWGDTNYYHLLINILPRLGLLADYDIAPEAPLIISPQLAGLPAFQQFRSRGSLSQRRWIVQDGFYIAATEVVCALVDPNNRTALMRTLDCFDAPAADPHGDRRLFITRPPEAGRALTNMEQLEPVLARHRFEVVDPGRLSVGQQMHLFSEARFVAGIHGAALTNILFRRCAPLGVLEIFRPHDVQMVYCALSRTLGYAYYPLVGNEGPEKPREWRARHWADFSLEPSVLDAALTKLVRTRLTNSFALSAFHWPLWFSTERFNAPLLHLPATSPELGIAYILLVIALSILSFLCSRRPARAAMKTRCAVGRGPRLSPASQIAHGCIS